MALSLSVIAAARIIAHLCAKMFETTARLSRLLGDVRARRRSGGAGFLVVPATFTMSHDGKVVLYHLSADMC